MRSRNSAAMLNLIPFGWGYLYLGRPFRFGVTMAVGLLATFAGVLIAVQISLRNSISYGKTGLNPEEVLAGIALPLLVVIVTSLQVRSSTEENGE